MIPTFPLKLCQNVYLPFFNKIYIPSINYFQSGIQHENSVLILLFNNRNKCFQFSLLIILFVNVSENYLRHKHFESQSISLKKQQNVYCIIVLYNLFFKYNTVTYNSWQHFKL